MSFFDIKTVSSNISKHEWYVKFSDPKKIKQLIIDIYKKYNPQYTLNNININNIERLHNNTEDITLYMCSFSFIDTKNETHTSIIIGFKKRYFIIHNYFVIDTAIDKDSALFIYDVDEDRVDGNPKLNDKLYLFLENNGKFAFNYTDNSSKEKYEKHIKFKDDKVTEIFDYLKKKFINYISNAKLHYAYINDKYIGNTAVSSNDVIVFNNNKPYITIKKDGNYFLYKINGLFSLKYIYNKNNIILEYNGYTFNFMINRIEIKKNKKKTIIQYYSINREYIPLVDNSTYISSLIMLINILPYLDNDLSKDIKEKNNTFFINDIKKYITDIDTILKTNNLSSNTNYDKLYNIINILINKNNNYIINRKATGKYKDDDGKEYDIYFVIKKDKKREINHTRYILDIITKNGTIDLVDITKNDRYYDSKDLDLVNKGYNKDSTNFLEIKSCDNCIINEKLNSISDENFLITFKLFGDDKKVIHTNFKVKNLLQVLTFEYKILIPSQIILFVGKEETTGYYITLQHDNNNWFVYDHKNRLIENYNEYMFNFDNTYPVFIYYKVFDGTDSNIYKDLENTIITDDYNSNDDTINYYLNPRYELLRFREQYIYENYNMVKANQAATNKEKKYEIEVDSNNKSVDAGDLFVSINQDLPTINLHTSTYITDYLKRKFSLDGISVLLIK
jgi:hypothetical protein